MIWSLKTLFPYVPLMVWVCSVAETWGGEGQRGERLQDGPRSSGLSVEGMEVAFMKEGRQDEEGVQV